MQHGPQLHASWHRCTAALTWLTCPSACISAASALGLLISRLGIPNIMSASTCRHHSTAAGEQQGEGGRHLWQNTGRLMLLGRPVPATPARRATAAPGAKCGEPTPSPPLSTNLCVSGMVIYSTSAVHVETQGRDNHAEGATRLENRWLQKTNVRRASPSRPATITHVFLPPCEAPILPVCRTLSVES